MTTIRELADKHGISLRAVRFYEEEGLLNPQRKGMRRLYSDQDALKLGLIVAWREAGFGMPEVKEMIHLVDQGRLPRLVQALRERLPALECEARAQLDAIERLAGSLKDPSQVTA